MITNKAPTPATKGRKYRKLSVPNSACTHPATASAKAGNTNTGQPASPANPVSANATATNVSARLPDSPVTRSLGQCFQITTTTAATSKINAWRICSRATVSAMIQRVTGQNTATVAATNTHADKIARQSGRDAAESGLDAGEIDSDMLHALAPSRPAHKRRRAFPARAPLHAYRALRLEPVRSP